MNEKNNISKCNASPLARGKPLSRQKAKGKRQRYTVLQLGDTLNFGLWTLNLPDRAKALLKMRDGPTRNAQRDGPRSREPGNRLTADGVPVTLIPELSVNSCQDFVKLCVYLLYFVIGETNLIVRYEGHTGQHKAMRYMRKTKTFRWNCNPHRRGEAQNFCTQEKGNLLNARKEALKGRQATKFTVAVAVGRKN